MVNCNQGGCPRCSSGAASGASLEECLCLHAEENTIAQAAYHGTSVAGSVIYTTHSPCLWCAKLLLNAGIGRVVYAQAYPMPENARQLFAKADMTITAYQPRR
jgi:dCMP deaminase